MPKTVALIAATGLSCLIAVSQDYGLTVKYSSAAIDALSRQIAGGDKRTDAFWQRVTMSGTPLVEPFQEDNRYQLVTFLWRGSAETRNVLVSGSFTKPATTDYLMNQLARTDVWYLTVKLPRGAR